MSSIDGKFIAKKITTNISRQVRYLKSKGTTPKLAVILVGENKPSQTYVRKKAESAKKVGIDFILYQLPAKIKKTDLIEKIQKIQKDKKLSGLIVQLPLPEPLYTDEVLNTIKPELDVDCLTNINIGKLVMKTNKIIPPTPDAVMHILDTIRVGVKGKNIVIIGTGALVGKPLAIIMMNAEATVTTCNSKTTNIKDKCLKADIIITAVGKNKNLLTANMVKKGTVVIDTGIVFENGKMYGDIDYKNIAKKASFITPTPGGVGPITVACLLKNTVICAKEKLKK